MIETGTSLNLSAFTGVILYRISSKMILTPPRLEFCEVICSVYLPGEDVTHLLICAVTVNCFLIACMPMNCARTNTQTKLFVNGNTLKDKDETRQYKYMNITRVDMLLKW